MQFLVDILPFGPGSVDPHIFAEPDPGSQNLADPMDPDPKHWICASISKVLEGKMSYGNYHACILLLNLFKFFRFIHSNK